MIIPRRRALAAIGAALSAPAIAQTQPSSTQPASTQPIRCVCGSSPGSITDLIARIVQPGLSRRLGQPVVVDNRPGAGGNLAAEVLARAAPDGQTIMVISGGIMTLNPYLYRELAFDPARDIKLVSRITAGGFLLAVPASIGVEDVDGLIAHLRRKGDAANYGSPGIGFAMHVGSEVFLNAVGAKAVHIPYRGSAAAINALVAGEVDFVFDSRGPLLPHLQSGKAKVIANGGSLPDIVHPDLPRLADRWPEVVVQSWTAVAAPAALPAQLVRRLDDAMRETLAEPEVVAQLRRVGNGPAYIGPEDFVRFYAEERERAARGVRIAGVQPQ
ncbi:Bug family tripartite tricarboxylate transporter substrate binding protein [Falsiroseomonas tokyonensis]|uniref:Bug family tripartite tricarboxylate transporter substrate binding protein n=1 Tax=Falsiroseomonas tokyonensis TaxID=430521 RepID=A0ABV7BX15_9PROT|nr:tripartite tricarboxylate transporter substrate binding protein [Falsiroseomonas tokyonensis]MBU8540162.1 tripartite tricarboxylate transporter substrate binding protein [Falsiroseomonas tokyonensis]